VHDQRQLATRHRHPEQRAVCRPSGLLEALLAGTKEEPVLLHPNMGAEYRKQVANLAQVLNREENRGEAADILRSLVDRIELRPNQQGRLEIDLYGDLAGILTLAGKKARPLDQDDLSVQQ
jgi:hypothetical protein